MNAILIDCAETGEKIERELPAGEFSWTVGRQMGADIRLDCMDVSRRHAVLSGDASGAVCVEDVGSTAGTTLNGRTVTKPVPFRVGDALSIGPYVLRLRSDAAQYLAARHPEVPPSDDVAEEFKNASILYTPEVMALTHRIHESVLEKMDLPKSALQEVENAEMREKLERCLDLAIKEHRHEVPGRIPMPLFRQTLIDELTGLGPIAALVRSPRVSEIMVNGPDVVFVESAGRLFDSGVKFFNERHLMSIIHRIVEPLGRHVDEASPMVDARLTDGSRVNAIISPLSIRGAALTIRKFSEKKLTTEDLVGLGSLTHEMAQFLEEAVRARKNILVSGGTGSGKTTLLNVLSLFIPSGERVITVEDSAELKLSHRNLVTLEARPPNVEGKGRVTIRDLVINCLRMRPDRIIVGECRGPEALDMLQAMNTGHDGSLTTCHANSPRDALSRLENMVLMAGMELPVSAIREQIASAIDLIVQQTRLPDGSRKIVRISEVTGREGDQVLMQDIFTYEQTGVSSKGKVEGAHCATGNIPQFIEEMRRSGRLGISMDVFVPKS